MSKKRVKLEKRIAELQEMLTSSLGKKSSSATEIDVGKVTRQIAEMKAELAKL